MAEKTENLPLRHIEDHWLWKTGIRAFIILINIIAIGSAGWLISSTSTQEALLLFNYIDVKGFTLGAIIVFVVSLIWCALWIIIPLCLKPRRPLHPGVAVGLDLILWLVFITVGTWTLFLVFSYREFGSDPTDLMAFGYGYGYGYGSSSDGTYYLAPNNTWVFNATSSSSTVTYDPYSFSDSGTNNSSTLVTEAVRDCTPEFDSCAAQDAFINQVWHEKPKKEALATLIDAVAWLDTALHFALFVWACVDTQRRNNKKTSRAMEQVADKIIADLERKGIVRVENGQVMRAEGPAPVEPYTLPAPSARSRQRSPGRQMSGGVENRDADAITHAA